MLVVRLVVLLLVSCGHSNINSGSNAGGSSAGFKSGGIIIHSSGGQRNDGCACGKGTGVMVSTVVVVVITIADSIGGRSSGISISNRSDDSTVMCSSTSSSSC